MPPSDGRFPMRVVTRQTGLPADTIRTWERRYGAVEPDRTEGQTRRYSSAEIRRLLLLKAAVGQGHAIGAIAQLPDDELEALAAAGAAPQIPATTTPLAVDGGPADPLAPLREHYLDAVARFAPREAMDLLARAAALVPARDFALHVAAPVLAAVGHRWAHQELGVAQEHLVSAQLRDLLATLTRHLPTDRGAPRVLVATPAGQRHDFGALIGAMLVAARGLEPIFLGADLPLADLRWAARMSRASLTLLSVVTDLEGPAAEDTRRTIEALAEETPVWVGLAEGHALTRAPSRARWFHRFEDLDLALADFRPNR